LAAWPIGEQQSPCERSFSTLKHIKTRLRNRLTNNNLEIMILMHLNNDMLDDIRKDRIIMEVAKQSGVNLTKIVYCKL